MAKIYSLSSSRKLTPKKETIDFLLAFSRSHISLKTKKQKRFMVCNN
ncbi:hypothetical protein [Profundicola chukchiensis]|nr:hypothetical protein [Profundicola chukchiensis]